MLGGRGVERIAFLMLDRVSSVHLRYDFGHSDAVRARPRYPLDRFSPCEIIGIGVWPTRTLARRA
jgi:hypothetical protein